MRKKRLRSWMYPRLHSGTAKPVTQVCVVPGLAFLSDVFFPNESVTAPSQMWGTCRFSPNWEGRGPAGWQRLGPSGPHQAGRHLRSGGRRKLRPRTGAGGRRPGLTACTEGVAPRVSVPTHAVRGALSAPDSPVISAHPTACTCCLG